MSFKAVTLLRTQQLYTMWNLIMVTSLVISQLRFAKACKSEEQKLGNWYTVGDWMVRTDGDDEYR